MRNTVKNMLSVILSLVICLVFGPFAFINNFIKTEGSITSFIDATNNLVVDAEESEVQYFEFGAYPCEDDTNNLIKTIPLKWRVIADEGDNYVLMLDRVLFKTSFGNQDTLSWKDSKIRDFLNNEFYNSAFSDSLKADIIESNNKYKGFKDSLLEPLFADWDDWAERDASINKEEYMIEGTSNDKVYLLSSSEYMNPEYGFSNIRTMSNTRIAYLDSEAKYIYTNHFYKDGFDDNYREIMDEHEIEHFIDESNYGAVWVWTRDIEEIDKTFGYICPTAIDPQGGIRSGDYVYYETEEDGAIVGHEDHMLGKNTLDHIGIQPVIKVKKESKYLLKTNPPSKPSYNNQSSINTDAWRWNHDNYSFTNSYSAFHEYTYLSFKDHKKLVNSLNPIDLFVIGSMYGADVIESTEKRDMTPTRASTRYINFLANQMDRFNGACYGMSLTASLFKEGLLKQEDYGAISTYDLSNSEVESLINYYHMSQSVSRPLFKSATDKTKEFEPFITSFFALGLKAIDKNSAQGPFMVGLNGKGGHAVICYGAEQGKWTYNGDTYHKRLLFADPNIKLNSFSERDKSCLYIDDDNNYAIYSGDNSYDTYSYCADLSALKNFELYKTLLNNTRLFTYGNNYSISSGDVWRSLIIGDNSKQLTGNVSLKANYFANLNLDSKDGTKNDYYFTFSDPVNDYSLMPIDADGKLISGPGILSASIASSNNLIGFETTGTRALIEDGDKLSIESAKGKVFVDVINDNSELDYISIEGQGEGDISVVTNEEEVLITGDLSNYIITNTNRACESETLVIPGDWDAKVTIKNKKLAAMVDKDANGTFETVIVSESSDNNGLLQGQDGKWAMYKNGKVDTSATGVFQNNYGWWRVEKGYVDFNAQGIYQNPFGWWKTTNGKVTFKDNGVFQNGYGWWRVKDSKVDFKAQGIYKNQYGWWKTTNGKVTFKENGVFQNEYGWWKVKDSKVDFGFTGIASNKYGSWYIKNGKVDFNKKGKVKYNNKTYTVKNGKVV